MITIACITGLMVTTAQAQIGWTLDQCKAKYGEPIDDNRDDQSQWIQEVRDWADGKTYIFNTSGFKLAITVTDGAVVAISYHPENSQSSISYKQAREILTKNANSNWKRDSELSDQETEALSTRNNNHVLEAWLPFASLTLRPPKFDHNAVEYVAIKDDTVDEQVKKGSEATEKENKAKEASKTQHDVDGL
jgi:hypothetical protein